MSQPLERVAQEASAAGFSEDVVKYLSETGLSSLADLLGCGQPAAEAAYGSLHPQALQFLQTATGADEAYGRDLDVLGQQAAVQLADGFIDSYAEVTFSQTPTPDVLQTIAEASTIAKRYIRGESADIIAGDYPERPPDSINQVVDSMATELQAADRAKRLNLPYAACGSVALVSQHRGKAGRSAPTGSQPAPLGEAGLTSDAYDQWLEARELHTRVLYGDGGDSSSSPEPEASLAALTLGADITNYHVDKAEDYLSKLSLNRSVGNILSAHDSISRRKDVGAIYGMINPNRDLPQITELTAQIIALWDMAWRRSHAQTDDSESSFNFSPFSVLPITDIKPTDFDRPDVQLVVETAAATSHFIHSGERDNSRLAIYLASHHPEYADMMLSGELFRNYCEAHGYDPEEWLENPQQIGRGNIGLVLSRPRLDHIKELAKCIEIKRELVENLEAITGWSKEKSGQVFQRSTLTDLVWQHHGEVFAKVNELAKRLDGYDYQPAAIAKTVGWSEQEVKRFFKTRLLVQIARRTDRPNEEFTRIARNYRITLSTSNLTAALAEFGLSEPQVDSLFVDFNRRLMATAVGDPIVAAKRVVTNHRAVVQAYPNMPERVSVYLANKNSTLGSALKAAEHVDDEQANRPPGVSETLWAWAVTSFPIRAERRMEMIASYRLWLTLLNSQKSVSAFADENPLDERRRYAGDTATDPSEMLMPSDAMERVVELAQKVGVSRKDLGALLSYFNQPQDKESPPPVNEKLLPALEKLKLAALNIDFSDISDD